MYLGQLSKITSNHNNLRTDFMEGVVKELPKVGDTFQIVGEGLEYGMRVIHTTEIKSIDQLNEDTVEFKTRNSTYHLRVKGYLGEDGSQKYIEEKDKGEPPEGTRPNIALQVEDGILIAMLGDRNDTESGD